MNEIISEINSIDNPDLAEFRQVTPVKSPSQKEQGGNQIGHKEESQYRLLAQIFPSPDRGGENHQHSKGNAQWRGGCLYYGQEVIEAVDDSSHDHHTHPAIAVNKGILPLTVDQQYR